MSTSAIDLSAGLVPSGAASVDISSGLVPSGVALEDNPAREGTYAMKGAGESAPTAVPYSKVSQAQGLGYDFSDPSGQQQYEKDKKYAPATGQQPGLLARIGNRMASNFQSNTQSIPTAGAPVSSAINNIGASAAKVVGAIPGFASDLVKAYGQSVKAGNPQAVVDLLDPMPMAQAVKDQFVSDWQQDPKMALENLLGTAGGLAITHEVAGKAGETAQAVNDKIAGKVQSTAQSLVGAGPRVVRQAVTDAAKQAAADTAARPQQLRDYMNDLQEARAHNSQVADAQARQEALGQGVQQSAADIGDQIQQLEKQTRATGSGKFKQVEQAVSQYNDANGNAADVTGLTPEQIQAQLGSGMLKPRYPGDITELQDAVDSAKNKLKGSDESLKIFNDITRKYVPPPAEPDTLTYQGAQIPKGHPLFDVLQKQYAESGLGPDGQPLTASKPLTFSDLQGYYTELGDAIGSRISTLGRYDDVARALSSLRDSIGGQMEDIAKAADKDGRAQAKAAGQEYSGSVLGQIRDARQYWKNFMQTFHEPTGPSGSGSPVAQAFNAVDPDKILAPFVGDAGDRGVQALAKYDPDLAQRVNTVRGLHDQWKSNRQPVKGIQQGLLQTEGSAISQPTPEVSTTAQPKPLGQATSAATDSEGRPLAQVPAEMRYPDLPASKGAPTVDLQQIRQDAIDNAAKRWGNTSTWDIKVLLASTLINPILHALSGETGAASAGLSTALAAEVGTRLALARVLDRPAIVQWLSQPSAADMRVIAKIPGADKVKILNSVTDEAVQGIQSQGKPTKIAPEVADFLGPQNAARLAAANVAVAQQTTKKRQEQPERSSQSQPQPEQPVGVQP